MRSFWSDPYLWVHLAGIAAVPLLLELCLLGIAVGDPIFPVGLEWLLVGAIGVAPILWMQWQRPFSIFSLVVLALQPQQLTADQRRILRLFKSPLEKGLAALTAVGLLAVLWQLFQIAPIASEVTPLVRFGHLGGLFVAAIAFLGSNLFLQVPISVLQTLLTNDRAFAATEPYTLAQIAQDFTLLGLRVKQILPPVQPSVKPSKPSVKSSVQPAVEAAPPASAVSTLPQPAVGSPPQVGATVDDFEDDFEDDAIDELKESELETIEIETAASKPPASPVPSSPIAPPPESETISAAEVIAPSDSLFEANPEANPPEAIDEIESSPPPAVLETPVEQDVAAPTALLDEDVQMPTIVEPETQGDQAIVSASGAVEMPTIPEIEPEMQGDQAIVSASGAVELEDEGLESEELLPQPSEETQNATVDEIEYDGVTLEIIKLPDAETDARDAEPTVVVEIELEEGETAEVVLSGEETIVIDATSIENTTIGNTTAKDEAAKAEPENQEPQ